MALLVCATAGGADKTKLAPRHRDWLEKEVGYIISKEEKEVFLKLPTDEDREKFIEQFWKDRDPTPGTPENEYKDEHYKRVQYANAYFGAEWNSDGWRTDRGKIWIVLGPPQGRQFHTSGGQIYPIELWFYNNPLEPSLPPFFYVMFYQKDGMSDYRLYSPYVDGPDKLIRASGAEGRRDNAYKFLATYNRELARASLTLIPSEPADIDSPASLSSDTMLMKVINIANDKFHKERLGLARRLRENVSIKIIPDISALRVAVFPLRDAAGQEFVHYSLQILEPPNYALGKYKDKYYLAMEAQIKVLDAQKRLVYETTREATAYYEEKDLDEVRSRPLSFDDRIPLVPGSYQIEFGLLNRVTHVYFKASTSVHVEPSPVTALKMGKAVFVQHCGPAKSVDEPFVMGNTRCSVLSANEVPPSATATLNVLYPVYLPDSLDRSGPPLKVRYTVGKLDRTITNQVTEDSLDRKRFDRQGTLLVGKSVPLKELGAGAYVLSVQINNPLTRQTSGATINFKVSGNALPGPNVLTPDSPAKDTENGNNDYWWGLSRLAQNEKAKAIEYFTRALQRNEKHAGARTKLAALYFEQGDFKQVAALLEASGLDQISDVDTLTKLMTSLEKTGQIQKAIQDGEYVTARLNPTAELFTEMAGFYERAGRAEKAQKARGEARKLAEEKKKKAS